MGDEPLLLGKAYSSHAPTRNKLLRAGKPHERSEYAIPRRSSCGSESVEKLEKMHFCAII